MLELTQLTPSYPCSITLLLAIFSLPNLAHALPQSTWRLPSHGQEHRPLQDRNSGSSLIRPLEHVQSYLKQFGYLRSNQQPHPSGAVYRYRQPSALSTSQASPLTLKQSPQARSRNSESHSESSAPAADSLSEAVRLLQQYAGIPVTGAIDANTLRLMSRPRCGVKDIRPTISVRHRRRLRRYLISKDRSVKWSKFDLTWSVKKYPHWMKNFQRAELHQVLQTALDVWRVALPFTFTFLGSGRSADIEVGFHNGSHYDENTFDGPGGVLAHAFFPIGDLSGDTHFDDAERWVFNNSDLGVNLLTVAAHEFGHALGLGHSKVSGSIMTPWYQDEAKLHVDDITGLRILYGYWKTPPPTAAMPTQISYAEPEKPNLCDGAYDAVTTIRSYIHIFKGRYFWRVIPKFKDGPMESTLYGPTSIVDYWKSLPPGIDRLDAVLESTDSRKVIVFVGQRYYVISIQSNRLVDRGTLVDLGLPNTLPKIDAAFKYCVKHYARVVLDQHGGPGREQSTCVEHRVYLAAGGQFWRLIERQSLIQRHTFPRPLADGWPGIPDKLDAAFSNTDGNLYFFSGQQYYVFDELHFKVPSTFPRPVTQLWQWCDQNDFVAIDSAGKENHGARTSSKAGKLGGFCFSGCVCSRLIVLLGFYRTVFALFYNDS